MRQVEDLTLNPERRAVHEALQQLHKEQHPHLPQYVATVVSPSGLTLREAAAVMGISYQRVAQLRDRGLRQISETGRLDLSWWPVLPPANPRAVRRQRPDKDLAKRLRILNATAKRYRPGQSTAIPLRFYRLVEELHDAGISYAAIARVLDENERVFIRRLARWGVTEGAHGRTKVVRPVQSEEEVS